MNPDLIHKTPVFDFKKGEFETINGRVKMAVGETGVRTWIEKIIRTELNRYDIYKGTGYGVVLEEHLVGHVYPKDYVRAEIGESIKTALLRHEGIKDVHINGMEIDGARLTWNLTVYLTTGSDITVGGEN